MQEFLRNAVLFVTRFSGFVAMALAFGLPLVDRLVARPALGRPPADPDAGQALARWRFGYLLTVAAVTTAVAAAAYLLIQGVIAAEFTGDLGWSSFDAVLETPFGRWYGVRLLAAVGLVVLAARGLRPTFHSDSRRERLNLLVWLAPASLILATSSLSGHASVARPAAAAIPNDVVHLAAGSVWFAGIVFLRAVLPAAWQERDEVGRLNVLAPVVRRFSHVAMLAMIVVTATGVVNSLLHVEALGDLVGSSYGIALLAKLILFTVILGLGGFNHFFLRRRLERALERREPDASRHVLRYMVGAEVAIALALFAATAALADLPRTKGL